MWLTLILRKHRQQGYHRFLKEAREQKCVALHLIGCKQLTNLGSLGQLRHCCFALSRLHCQSLWWNHYWFLRFR